MLRVLLIQQREPEDVMEAHEQACVRRRAADLDVQWVFRNAVVEPAQPEWLDDVDAFVIGGSGRYSVHHPKSERWVSPMRRLMDTALARELPGFLICFGHQLLGLHLGNEIVTSAEHTEIGTVRLTQTDEGQLDPLLAQMPQPFTAQTGHSDHVVGVPEGCRLLASTELVPNQAMRYKDTLLYTAQFHPDLTGAEARSRYLATHGAKLGAKAVAISEKFEIDQDDAALLLKRFLTLVAER